MKLTPYGHIIQYGILITLYALIKNMNSEHKVCLYFDITGHYYILYIVRTGT